MKGKEVRTLLKQHVGWLFIVSGTCLVGQLILSVGADPLTESFPGAFVLGSVGFGLPFLALLGLYDRATDQSPRLAATGAVLAVLSLLMLVCLVGTAVLLAGVLTVQGIETGTTRAKLVFGGIAVVIFLPATAYGFRRLRKRNLSRPVVTPAGVLGGAWVAILVAGMLQVSASGSFVRSIPGFPFFWTVPLPFALSAAVFGAAFLRRRGPRRLAGIPLLGLAATWVVILGWDAAYGGFPAWLPIFQIQAIAFLALGTIMVARPNTISLRLRFLRQ